MAETDLEVLRRLYGALEAGDFATVVGMLPDDFRTHVPGRSPVAGDHVGREAVAGNLKTLTELSGGLLRFELHVVLAGDGHGLALVRVLARRGDRSLGMENVHNWHFTEGRPVDVWIYPGDLYAWDAFWS